MHAWSETIPQLHEYSTYGLDGSICFGNTHKLITSQSSVTVQVHCVEKLFGTLYEQFVRWCYQNDVQ